MNRIRVAVIARVEDGVFQPMLLKPLASGDDATIYRLAGCVLRSVSRAGDGPAILSLADLNEDVFVFVNVPLETANHLFLEALVDLASGGDCGVASGVLIDERRRILSSGLKITSQGELEDAYAGQLFRPSTLEDVRAVTRLAPYFFAVRREILLAVGGLGVLSSRRMPELLERLSAEAEKTGLKLCVSPNAIGTLSGALPWRSPMECPR